MGLWRIRRAFDAAVPPACGPIYRQARCPYRRRVTQLGDDAPGEGEGLLPPHHRRMVGPLAERTLITAIAPKGIATIHTTVTTASRHIGDLLDFAARSMSIVLDFLVETTGAGGMNLSWLGRLPTLTTDCDRRLRSALRIRALRLYCLTIHYSALWYSACMLKHPRNGDSTKNAIDAFRPDAWTRQDPCLPNDWLELTPEWHRDHARRTDCARRQALVEIDVLAAKRCASRQAAPASGRAPTIRPSPADSENSIMWCLADSGAAT